jgi:hypothetical protein
MTTRMNRGYRSRLSDRSMLRYDAGWGVARLLVPRLSEARESKREPYSGRVV